MFINQTTVNQLLQHCSVFVIKQYAEMNAYKKTSKQTHKRESAQALFTFSDILRTAVSQPGAVTTAAVHQLFKMLLQFKNGDGQSLADYDTFMATHKPSYNALLRYGEWLWLSNDLVNNALVRKSVEKFIDQSDSTVKASYQQVYVDCIQNHDTNKQKLQKSIRGRSRLANKSPMTCPVRGLVTAGNLPMIATEEHVDIEAITHDIVYAGVLQHLEANKCHKNITVTVADMLKYCTALYESSHWTSTFDDPNHIHDAARQGYLVTHVEFALHFWGMESDSYEFITERKFITDNMYYFMLHQHYEIVGEFVIALQRMKPTEEELILCAAAKFYLILQLQNNLNSDNRQQTMRYRPFNTVRHKPFTEKTALLNFYGHTVYCVARALMPA